MTLRSMGEFFCSSQLLWLIARMNLYKLCATVLCKL